MKTSTSIFSWVALLVVLSFARMTLASDHIDSLGTEADPFADLLDLYAFVSPVCVPDNDAGCEDDPEELILVLTVKSLATGSDQFPNDVIYHFYLENDSGTSSQIDCTFSFEQIITCQGLGGRSIETRVGEISAQGDLRVFAGLRDDPFFFDLEAFAEFETVGVNAFEFPGTDFFAGNNVLSIVLGVKITAIPAGSSFDTNIQKIWAASERTGGDGLNGAISGSWYNPAQDGQGWLVEVIRLPNGEDKFVVYFYGYELGEQVWLVGSSGIEASTATVDMVRTSGAEWGNAFDKDDVTFDVIGTMVFEFLDCNTATVEFSPGDTSLTAFSTSMQRLTNISSMECRLLTSGQVDRVGRPLASTLFVPEELKDSYNTASDPDSWPGLFTDEFLASIESLDLADGIAGNLLGGDAQALAALFVDDRLQIDLKQPACKDYGAVEIASLAPGQIGGCGGRGLQYDVVDDTLRVVVSGLQSELGDYVGANDAPFLSVFPFLAPPNKPISYQSMNWDTATPEAQGMDSGVLADMIEELLDLQERYRLHQVVVIRNGQEIANVPFYPFSGDRLHDMASIGKMITVTLIGIAIDKGFIASVDEPVLSFFPGWEIANRDARKEALTIAHLLAQRSGLDIVHADEEMSIQAGSSWVQGILDQPMAIDPGGDYSYTNANMHLAAAILNQATGLTPLEFAREHLYGPLGITDVIWRTDPQGINWGAGGQMHLLTDLAKIGSLYLNGGKWLGQQIVSSDWVTLATTAYPGPQPPGWGDDWSFGFAWIINEQLGIMETGGSGGQVIRIWPDEDMIVLSFAGGGPAYNECASNGAVMNDVLGDYISTAVKGSQPIPPNLQEFTRFASLVGEAALPSDGPAAPPQTLPAIASSISGVRYNLDSDSSPLKWLSLTFSGGDEAYLDYLETYPNDYLDIPQRHAFTLGLDNVFHVSVDDSGFLYAAKGWWIDDNRFVLLLDQMSLWHYYYAELLFAGDDVTLTLDDRACGDPTVVLTGHKLM